jgi:F0F1-type ATP synthase epsilon subunit
MADKLNFALVSPERELFQGEVDHVVAAGQQPGQQQPARP